MVSDSGMKFDFLIKLVQEDNLIKKVDQLKYKIQLYTEQQRIRNKSFNQAINNLENILKLRGYALLKNWGIFEHSIKDRELDKVLEKKIDNNIRQVAKKDHKMKTMRNIRERAMKANGCFKSPGEKTEVPKGVLTPLRAEAPKGVLTPLRNEAKINGTPQGQKARERKNYGNSVNDNSNYYIYD